MSSFGRGRGATASNPSLDSRSERDLTKDRDVTMTSKRTEASHSGSSSRGTGQQDSYDLYYPEKVEYSCDEAGECQKLSFLFLVIAFIGHGIAVCTPYWVIAYDGDQMSLYEGVWLSCVRKNRDLGNWFCSNYGTVRNVLSHPSWFSAAQVCAFLGLILLIPALVAGTLYSYVVALRGRSRASWVLLSFLATSAVLSFLSFVIFGGGYDMDQRFPAGSGRPRFHISFALQIISWAVVVLSIVTHVRDVWGSMKIWDNNKKSGTSGFTSGRGEGGIGSSTAPVVHASTGPPPKSPGRKIPSFTLPNFPAALSRFRFSKKESPSSPPAQQAPPLPLASSAMAREEFSEEPRGAIGGRLQPSPAATSSDPSGRAMSYESYAPPVNESFRSRDSQV